MESKNLVGMILALTVGIICVGSIMVPVLSDAMTTEDTYTNDGIFRMSEVNATDEIILKWEYQSPNQVTVDGVSYDLPESVSIPLSVCATNDFFVRYSPGTNTAVTAFVGAANVFASVTNQTDLTLTISSGSISVTNGPDTQTATFTDNMFVISEDGDYVMKNSNESVYLNGDSPIYGFGRTYLTNMAIQTNFNVAGTAAGTFDIEAWGSNSTGLTVPEYTVNATEENGHIDLYKFSNVVFKVTNGTLTDTVTYGQVIVPYEVTAERAVHFDAAQIAMLAVIPIVMLVAILMIAVRAVNRD